MTGFAILVMFAENIFLQRDSMEIKTEIDPSGTFRRHTVTGEVVAPEIFAALKALFAETPEAREMSSLWDLTRAVVKGDSADVRALSDMVGRIRGQAEEARLAIVASGDLVYGLARMYETHLSARTTPPVQTFRTVREAEAWLRSGPEERAEPR